MSLKKELGLKEKIKGGDNMKKIAVIDSGLGGLTVAKAIIEKFPNEEIYYFGDTKRCPYGDKTKEEITTYVYEMLDFLIKKELKLIVIACNTVSSFLVEEIEKKYKIPTIGMIEAGATSALLKTKNKKIGVLATKVTIESDKYGQLIKNADNNCEVVNQACPKLVPLIESKKLEFSEIKIALEEYLKQIKRNKVDTVILGCTHYPLIRKEIQKEAGNHIQIIDPAEGVLERINYYLIKEESDYIPQHKFFVSGNEEEFVEKAEKWLGEKIEVERIEVMIK